MVVQQQPSSRGAEIAAALFTEPLNFQEQDAEKMIRYFKASSEASGGLIRAAGSVARMPRGCTQLGGGARGPLAHCQ